MRKWVFLLVFAMAAAGTSSQTAYGQTPSGKAEVRKNPVSFIEGESSEAPYLDKNRQVVRNISAKNTMIPETGGQGTLGGKKFNSLRMENTWELAAASMKEEESPQPEKDSERAGSIEPEEEPAREEEPMGDEESGSGEEILEEDSPGQELPSQEPEEERKEEEKEGEKEKKAEPLPEEGKECLLAEASPSPEIQLHGWQTQDGKTYYYHKGKMVTGWKTIGKYNFYFKKAGALKGVMFTGWQNVGSQRYYFKKTGSYGSKGAVLKGFQTLEGRTYYLYESGEAGILGRMMTGWQTIKGRQYYFIKRAGYRGKMLTGWNTIGNDRYYFKLTGPSYVRGVMLKGFQELGNKVYYFGRDGKLKRACRVGNYNIGVNGERIRGNTLKGLLQNSLTPIASSLYVLGGGHGLCGSRLGVQPSWKYFYDSKDRSYSNSWSSVRGDGKGLDCSGFVGWTVYNTVYSKGGGSSCSAVSSAIPGLYKSRGWGSLVKSYQKGSFQTGDIVAWKSGNTGHVWIVLGRCRDGSYVFVHSTPAGGPQISASINRLGNPESQGVALARKYMKKYFKEKVGKLALYTQQPAKDYLYGPSGQGLYRFRWNLTNSSVMADPDGYRFMSAEEILEDLFR